MNKENRGLSKTDSQALKGIAVCILLFHHLFNSKKTLGSYGVQFLLLSSGQAYKLAVFCKICVHIFVFVTAYGISSKFMGDTLNRSSIEKTAMRRIKALMVPYWLVFAVFQIICNITGAKTFAATYGRGLEGIIYFVTDALAISDAFGSPTLNPTWWYMTLALELVCILPLICMIEKRTGWLLLPAMFLLFRAMDWTGYCSYFLTAILGVIVQSSDIMGIMSDFLENRKAALAAFAATDLILLALCVYMTNNLNKGKGWGTISLVAGTFLIVSLYNLLLKKIPLFTKALSVPGRYSMGIFLIHTFIFDTFFKDFIYSFKYSILIWGALFLSSLAAAAVFEFVRIALLQRRTQ